MLEEDNLQDNKLTIDPNIIDNLMEKQNNNEESISPIKLIHINKKKYELQEKILIEDIEVTFPYKPYEKQITYMKKSLRFLR